MRAQDVESSTSGVLLSEGGVAVSYFFFMRIFPIAMVLNVDPVKKKKVQYRQVPLYLAIRH